MSNIVNQATEFAKAEYAKHDPMHRWDHVEQVMEMALYLEDFYRAETDPEILRLAVIFHDIWYENYDEHADKSVDMAIRFLKSEWYPEEKIALVTRAMLDHSWPHRRRDWNSKNMEWKILYDSDKFHLALNPSWYEKYFNQFYLPETKIRVLEKRNEVLC
ncbi:MAG: hypothetical protein ACD_2C00251G0002 [uncultured bacterium (gcode 4)]|uniref:HD domain-containing protein n=1 Tax=uncultured bacterium (gcode 4) TaxID=1234023 RepID=K2FD04_9BACT|nr:MAG: hypothetical protein ACD_2C00251G0002 [uncultured bacterium (gcode 4)]